MVDPHRYPHHPGAQGEGMTRATSEATAVAIAPSACFLQMVALRSLGRVRLEGGAQ